MEDQHLTTLEYLEMKKEVVPREDGRVTIYYSFADEGGVQTSDREPRPASTAQPSATDSDVVTEGER